MLDDDTDGVLRVYARNLPESVVENDNLNFNHLRKVLDSYEAFNVEGWRLSKKQPSFLKNNIAAYLEIDLPTKTEELSELSYAKIAYDDIYVKSLDSAATGLALKLFEVHEDFPELLWSRPALGGHRSHLSRLMTWWALLFAISNLARYEPALWSDALQFDNSEDAVPLDSMLALCHEEVLTLVCEALGLTTVLRSWRGNIPMSSDEKVLPM